MKTSLLAVAGVVAAAIGTSQAAALTAQEHITMFNSEDFAFSLGGPEPSALVNGFQIRAAFFSQIPALEGQGISMAIVNLDPCTINLPHLHPRATEMSYVIKGEQVRMAFVEENGGEGAVVNDLRMGDVAFFPQGLIHYQQNLDCEPAIFLAALNNEDPGAVTVTTRFFELPTEAIQASLNFEEPELKALMDSLPMAPAEARAQCLERCGMVAEDTSPMDDPSMEDSSMDDSSTDDSSMDDSSMEDDSSSESDDHSSDCDDDSEE